MHTVHDVCYCRNIYENLLDIFGLMTIYTLKQGTAIPIQKWVLSVAIHTFFHLHPVLRNAVCPLLFWRSHWHRERWQDCKSGNTVSSRHVSSCVVTRAVAMRVAINAMLDQFLVVCAQRCSLSLCFVHVPIQHAICGVWWRDRERTISNDRGCHTPYCLVFDSRHRQLTFLRTGSRAHSASYRKNTVVTFGR